MKNVIERMLNLLAFLLTVDRPVTAEEIRETIAGYDRDNDEAFHRMFERDKDLLRSLGIPLELRFTDSWEVEQGYVVVKDDYELPDPGLNDEERAALWLAAQVVRVGGQPSGPEAILKLGGASMVGAGEPLAANLGLAADTLGLVFTAVAERRSLSFRYRESPRTINPYGMRHQSGHWYVVGPADAQAEIRAYRIDRGSDFATGEKAGAFARPVGFSVQDALPNAPWEAGSDDSEAVIVFDSEIAWWVLRQIPPSAQVLELPDGALEVRLAVANVDALIGWVLGFEDKAEIVSPVEIREALVARVRDGI